MMKRLFYIVPILIASCGRTSNQDTNYSSQDSTATIVGLSTKNLDTTKIAEESIESVAMNDVEIFEDFAINYSATRKPNSGVAMLPETPDTVLNAMRIIKTSHPKEFEKYLTLIFVKLYSAHLECCHQSYEIRRERRGSIDKEKDPLVYEFNHLAKKYKDDKSIEFISSSFGYDYIKENPHLLDFEPINNHYKVIEQIHKNIEGGIYWK